MNLLPNEIKNLMRTIKNVGKFTVMGTIVLLALMKLMGFFADLTTEVIFASVILTAVMPLIIPGFMFEKVSQSTVQFTRDQILLLSSKGKRWRSIPYGTINCVQIKEVNGFFYGRNKNQFKSRYICIFLNGTTEMPHVSFSKLFSHKNFVMIHYQKETMEQLQQVWPFGTEWE